MKSLVALVCLLALVAGCKKDNPMVGTWTLEFAQKGAVTNPSQASVKMEFKDDNTFTIATTFHGDTRSSEGTYRLDGKSLTISAKGPEGTPGDSRVVTLADDMKSFDPPSGSAIGKMIKQP